MRSQVFVQFCFNSLRLETQLIWRRKLSLWIWKLCVIRGKMTHPNSPEEPPNFHVALNVCDSDFSWASHVRKVWIWKGIWIGTHMVWMCLDIEGDRTPMILWTFPNATDLFEVRGTVYRPLLFPFWLWFLLFCLKFLGDSAVHDRLCGELCVYPGSHMALASYFKKDALLQWDSMTS